MVTGPRILNALQRLSKCSTDMRMACDWSRSHRGSHGSHGSAPVPLWPSPSPTRAGLGRPAHDSWSPPLDIDDVWWYILHAKKLCWKESIHKSQGFFDTLNPSSITLSSNSHHLAAPSHESKSQQQCACQTLFHHRALDDIQVSFYIFTFQVGFDTLVTRCD